MRDRVDTARRAIPRAWALLFLGFAACASPPRHPIDTVFGFEPLRTTVDSELAARYLRWLGREEQADAGLGQFAALEAKYDALPLTTAALEALSREISVDFATVYFARRMLRVPRHQEAQRRFGETLARLRADDRPHIEGVDPARYLLLFVPGLFYRSHPGSNAAMEGPRAMYRALGFETRLVEIDEMGGIEENARVVAGALERLRGTGRRVVVFSASKGGADVAHALGSVLAGRNLDHVVGWVSLGGILHGSPRADGALVWPRSWLVGATGWLTGSTLTLARDLSTETCRRRTKTYTFPEHLVILHYVSTPFSGTVSSAARGPYLRMRARGPNDGVTLLPDQLLPSGHAVIAVGLDHYFRDPDVPLRTLALAELIFTMVEQVRLSVPSTIPTAIVDCEGAFLARDWSDGLHRLD